MHKQICLLVRLEALEHQQADRQQRGVHSWKMQGHRERLCCGHVTVTRAHVRQWGACKEQRALSTVFKSVALSQYTHFLKSEPGMSVQTKLDRETLRRSTPNTATTVQRPFEMQPGSCFQVLSSTLHGPSVRTSRMAETAPAPPSFSSRLPAVPPHQPTCAYTASLTIALRLACTHDSMHAGQPLSPLH